MFFVVATLADEHHGQLYNNLLGVPSRQIILGPMHMWMRMAGHILAAVHRMYIARGKEDDLLNRLRERGVGSECSRGVRGTIYLFVCCFGNFGRL